MEIYSELPQPEVQAELSMSLTTTGSFPGGMRDKGGSRLLCSAQRGEGQLGKSAGVDKTNVAAHPEGILQSSLAKKESDDLKSALPSS